MKIALSRVLAIGALAADPPAHPDATFHAYQVAAADFSSIAVSEKGGSAARSRTSFSLATA